MSSRRIILALALLSALLLVPTAIGAPMSTIAQVANDSPNPDSIVLTVELPGDHRGLWTIEHRYRLEDENDQAAFDDLATDIDANESAYVDRFENRMNATAADAETATDRNMAIENVSIETETRNLPQAYGIVRYQFEWHGFALVDEDRMAIGDAIGGMFLDEGTSLIVQWPDGYHLDSVRPTPDEEDERRVRWRGPEEFGGDEPRIELTTSPAGTSPLDLTMGTMLLGLLAIVGLAGGSWWVLRERRSEEPTDQVPETGSVVPPDELLSNEEQVIQLLENHGSRMKQQEVVEALGWTDAKTSQVVSTLRDEGEIESFRLGRENVLRLPVEDEDADVEGEP